MGCVWGGGRGREWEEGARVTHLRGMWSQMWECMSAECGVLSAERHTHTHTHPHWVGCEDQGPSKPEVYVSLPWTTKPQGRQEHKT